MSETKSISEWQAEVHALSRAKGWHDGDDSCLRDDGTVRTVTVLAKLDLVHCEVSEATEAARVGAIELYLDPRGKPEGLAAEMADVVIRAMDVCGALGVDLQAAITAKHAYNLTRPHRHGGKLA